MDTVREFLHEAMAGARMRILWRSRPAGLRKSARRATRHRFTCARGRRRDVDIVLIDGLKPFGNGELMPLGRLREPMEALARADAFVITRSELSRITPAIERKLREYNSSAP